MLIISLTLSFALLVVANGCACLQKRVGLAALAPWPFLLLGYCSSTLLMFPTAYLIHATLVVVAASLCGILAARRWVFVSASLLATLLTYGIGSYFAVEYVTTIYSHESLEERLSYESRRDELPRRLGLFSAEEPARTFDDLRLDDVENAVENRREHKNGQLRTDALRRLHEDKVSLFVNSPSFGVKRMSFYEWQARSPEEMVIPMASLATAEPAVIYDEEVPSSYATYIQRLEWLLHRDSVADFLNSLRFGYVKDRGHVGGFQAHQFSKKPAFPTYAHAAPEYQLKRLELVSLLKHEQPSVYLTENLPRMDLLRDVPMRALDDFERDNLKRLWLGDDIAVAKQGEQLRMLGAIRAGKQCLTCHDAQRGDLLGAFSYHLDPAR